MVSRRTLQLRHLFEGMRRSRRAAQQNVCRAVLPLIQRSVVGRDKAFMGPFGWKPMVYADWTASGKSLSFVEDYIREQVLPFYGNTHTSTSITGRQTTCFRQEARQIIGQCCNAHRKNDVIVFTGTGTTGAVNSLLRILGIDESSATSETPPAVVFVS